MLSPGQKFSHFVIERKLGEGGMGAVYLAKDTKLNRNVALKILVDAYFEDAERLERFDREAKTAAQISHANVMSIFDIGTGKLPDSDKDIHYIVMEYIDGTPLGAYIAETSPDMSGILRLASRIAAGLAEAHHKGIVHRDIKPENILVDRNGEPHILDFGLAKPSKVVQFEGEEDESTGTISEELTRAGKILGTVKYMSPEQVRGERVDYRSDIFSFGILLYQMVTGNLPFAGESQVSTLAKILESQPEPPHVKNAAVPGELERILTKCLCKDPNDRYQDTRDLVVDLRALRRQYDSGVTESISGPAPRQAKPAKLFQFNLTWKLVIVMLALMIFLSGVVDTCMGPGDEDGNKAANLDKDQLLSEALQGIDLAKSLQAGRNTLAVLNFVNKSGDTTLDWLESGLPEIMLTDLAQSSAINVISSERILDRLGVRPGEPYSREDFVETAEELGAEKLLSGSFLKVGDQLLINARLEDITTGQILLGEKVVGSNEFELIDSLTNKIAVSLDVKDTELGDVDVASFASSPEAYRRYHKGMEYFNTAQYDEAIREYEAAIAIDSSFALPYMRIGMIDVFRGRQQAGAEYLARAERRKENLPRKERALLNIYVDLWQRQNFEEAYQKIKDYVKTYPTDKEGRTFYALAIQAFESDPDATRAQLDTVLDLDPDYAFALQQYAAIEEQHDNWSAAIGIYERLVEAYPESADFIRQLASLYATQGEFDRAGRLYDQALKLAPGDADLATSLYILRIREREFDAARKAIETIARNHSDDHFRMVDYNFSLANLAMWRGQFLQSMDYRRQALAEARQTGDDDEIWTALNSLYTYFQRFEMTDSAITYLRQAYPVANFFRRVNYPLSMVELDPASVTEMRPLFERDIQEFKTRFPQQMHDLISSIEGLFEATAAADTPQLISSYEMLIASQQGSGEGNERGLGIVLVEYGQYQRGIELLERFADGPDETTNGWVYPIVNYYLGRAHEGLGQKDRAVKYYREMLSYWSDPDIVIDEIADARERLSRLTS